MKGWDLLKWILKYGVLLIISVFAAVHQLLLQLLQNQVQGEKGIERWLCSNNYAKKSIRWYFIQQTRC